MYNRLPTMNSRLVSVANKLRNIACRSNMTQQHAAVLLKGSTPIVYGFNTIRGNDTYHAEHDVIRRYLLTIGLPYEKQQCILHGPPS
jgi:hypothetical protein